MAAIFLGNTDFTPSTATNPVNQVVARSGSATTVSSSQDPSAAGQSVHFTAQVVPTGNGAGTPGGTVQFVVDGTNFGNPVSLNPGGSATSGSNAALSVGNHSVSADYSGSSDFTATNGTLSGGQKVNALGSSVTVTASMNPSVAGAAVIFTAAVGPVAPAPGTPTGAVQFTVDGANAGSPVALTGGIASFSTNSLAVGSHTIGAAYSGDATFGGATGSLGAGETVAAPAAVSPAVTPPGAGYWTSGKNRGVFTFGDASFYGSTGIMVLNKPVWP